MAILQFEQLSFAYPGAARRALRAVSLSMEPGEYVVLCGPSGCGKTTLLRQAKRELAPAGAMEGAVYYDGTPLTELAPERAFSEIGYVQQDPENQIVTDYVWHELAFGLENLALPTPVIRRRVAEMAAFFGMEGWFRKKTEELSGGQKQMLNLAAVMAMNPKLLILDEPTSMLDPLAGRALLDAVERINRELGVAVLLTEHRLDAVFPVADRVVVMEGGKIAADGPPAEMAERLSRSREQEPLWFGLPAPVRICGQLGARTGLPLTVRDASLWLHTHLKPGWRAETPEPAPPPRPSKKELVLQGQELWFRYSPEGNDVLRGASLALYRGEFLCLLGGNGTGKSTLLKVLAGLRTPYRGKVKGQAGLAMLPQNPQALFTQDSVWLDFLETGSEEEAERWADRLGLTGLLKQHPFDLSGGELQRTALCKLLLTRKRVLLLDEPTKGLDAYAKRQTAELLQGLAEEGAAILAVTHDVEFAASYARRCAMMFDGGILSTDEPHAFFAGNRFYTTDANRIAAPWAPEAITCEEAVAACREGLAL